TVTLNAPTDANVINEMSTITVSSSGLQSKTFNITVSDQSTITIQTSVSSATLAEGGASGGFNVTLSNPPSSNMTVNISSNNANVTRNPTSLVFTTGNYN